MALSEATNSVQVVNSKKRPRVDTVRQIEGISDVVRDSSKQSELLMLREALKAEKDGLHKLYRDLDEEREASMTAANEALAMITRLQEEKAAVLLEARHHKLAAEQRETYNQHAMNVLKETLLFKEDELLALQELLTSYKEKLIHIEIEKMQCLEDKETGDQLLLLTNSATPTSPMDSYHSSICHDHMQGYDSSGGFRASHYVHKIAEQQKELLESDCVIHDQFGFQNSIPNGDVTPEQGTGGGRQEQPLGNMSTSISTRLKRLEERFEYLRQKQQIDEHYQPGFNCHYHKENPCNLKPEEREKVGLDADSVPPRDRKPRCSRQSDVPVAVHFNGNDGGVTDDGLKGSPYETGTLGIQNSAHEPRRAVSIHQEQSALFSEVCDDENETVHDVYEVQSEVKHLHPAAKDCSKDNNGQSKLENKSREASVNDLLHEADKDSLEVGWPVPGEYTESEACTAVAGKLSIGISPLDVKDVLANALDDDVQQLKARLQALEGERVFMKEAIDSLREENKELKVLQELAHQLQDLRIDVKKEGLTGQWRQPSVLNFLKGLFSFVGHQGPAASRSNRCVLQSCSVPTRQRQDGLLHILDEGSAIVETARVKREHKVKLNVT